VSPQQEQEQQDELNTSR